MTDVRSGPTTLYAQIASILRSRISGGSLRPLSPLPPIDELCASYGVSRPTIRQAIHMLTTEGLLVSRRGKPATVAANVENALGSPFRDIFDGTLELEPDHEIAILESEDGVRPPADLCFVGEQTASYRRIKKIHRSGGVPYCVMELFIDSEVVGGFPPDIEQRAKIAPMLMKNEGLRIVQAKERIVVAAADFEEAHALDYPMAGPVARMIRILCDEDNRAVYVGHFSYRGDRFGMERDRGNYITRPWENMQR